MERLRGVWRGAAGEARPVRPRLPGGWDRGQTQTRPSSDGGGGRRRESGRGLDGVRPTRRGRGDEQRSRAFARRLREREAFREPVRGKRQNRKARKTGNNEERAQGWAWAGAGCDCYFRLSRPSTGRRSPSLYPRGAFRAMRISRPSTASPAPACAPASRPRSALELSLSPSAAGGRVLDANRLPAAACAALF